MNGFKFEEDNISPSVLGVGRIWALLMEPSLVTRGLGGLEEWVLLMELFEILEPEVG